MTRKDRIVQKPDIQEPDTHLRSDRGLVWVVTRIREIAFKFKVRLTSVEGSFIQRQTRTVKRDEQG